MNRRGGRAIVALATAAALLSGCSPGAQNGDTVFSLAVVPAPASITQTAGAPFRLGSGTRVEGEADAAAALAALVSARTGLELPSTGSGTGGEGSGTGREGPGTGGERSGTGGERSGTGGERSGTGDAITLRVERGGPAESYRLTADEASVTVIGADAAGLFYGVQTLGQLLTRDGDAWVVPAVEIDDAPRFAYRGVMLDVARHFQPVDTVKAYIDRAAGLKFNALHLHLTDDQGWRIHLDSRPKLTELASGTSVGGDPGGFYSKDDYREIVEYAASRHLIVVPEVDMPGHTHAVGLAYPELVEEPVITDHVRDVVRDFGGELPETGRPYDGMAVGFSSLRIHDEATYDFVADVFGELAAMTPGPYLHLGGDEALGTDPDDFAMFVTRTSEIIADLGKTPVAWHEAGAATDLADATVGQYWGYVIPQEGMDVKARDFIRHGGKLILSPADAIYLDMKYPDGPDLGLTWANGPTSVERAYSWEPGDVIRGIDESDILGIEAPLWTETIRDLDDIDTMAFPRAAAAAEAAWSPATGASDLRTWRSFRHRVGELGPLWTSLGIGFHPADEIDWTTE